MIPLAIAMTLIFALAALGTARVRGAARRHGVLDVPGHRSSHQVPTPRGGGVAIVLAALAGLGVLAALFPDMADRRVLTVILGAAAMGVLGFIDDLKGLSPRTRLAVQLAAALAVAVLGVRLDALWVPFLGAVDLGWLAYPLTALAIAAIANFFNFMDGIDGLAGGQALLFGLFLAYAATSAGNIALAAAFLTVAAAAGGFLVFNFPPASIFMGDSGSLFLGFFFAAAGVALAGEPAQPLPFALTLLIMLTFIFDPALTILRRLLKGEPLHQAHRSHLYQRLNILGYPHRTITLGEYTLTLALGGAALWTATRGEAAQSWACLAGVAAFCAIAGMVHWLERRARLG